MIKKAVRIISGQPEETVITISSVKNYKII